MESKEIKCGSDFQELISYKDQTKQSFYYLEMFVEPSGMRECFHMVTGNASNIRQMIIARIKSYFGFYALLSYGQTIRVHRYIKGQQENVIDILPFLEIEIPNELTAFFTTDGKAAIKDREGNSISEGYLSDLLFEYRASEEEKETVSLGDWETKIGELSEAVAKQGDVIEIEGMEYISDIVYEIESGEEYAVEEFLEILKGE